jgi:pyrroloquinoline quinone (PQQ) biosynthesis protein C
MKTVLPLPEQDGFELTLPPRVVLARGAVAQCTTTGIAVVKNNKRISANITAKAAAGLCHALNPSIGILTSRLASPWQQLLQILGAAGMLSTGREYQNASTVAALDAIAVIKDRICMRNEIAFPEDHRFNRFLSGKLGGVRRWLIENYYYTRSAPYHIGPVLAHQHTDFERKVWQRFLVDESWHWKIYRPAFSELGVSMRQLDSDEPHCATVHFVDTLHRIATASPIAYAAAMTFIEEPPLADSMNDDDLSQALMHHHGLSRKAVRPLWWHATENRNAGHSALGPIVLSQRRVLSRIDFDDAVKAVDDIIDAVSCWQHAILGDPDTRLDFPAVAAADDLQK